MPDSTRTCIGCGAAAKVKWCSMQCRERHYVRPGGRNYDYKKTLSCAVCAQPMHKGRSSKPQGEAICHPCRRKRWRPCQHCSAPITTHGALRYCSRACHVEACRRAMNPNKVRRAKRFAHAPGLTAAQQQALRLKWQRQGRTCTYCPGPPDTVDHVIPLVRGGTNYEGNLTPSCRRCNASKYAWLLMEWRTGRRCTPIGYMITPRGGSLFFDHGVGA